MSVPTPQRYRAEGRRAGIDPDLLDRVVATVERIHHQDPRITPVLTLRHLAELSETPYLWLRDRMARYNPSPYNIFYLKKRIPGRSRVRMICAPNRRMLALQRWIVEHILQYTRVHAASYAFHPGSRPYDAAAEHSGCGWLLKVDLDNFFHSIREGQVYQIFADLGFPKLLSFELARLVTIAADDHVKRPDPALRWPAIPHYQFKHEGFLPQGAPTSPMLANLAMFETDEVLQALADAHGMTYTRYADDLAFSCGRERTRKDIKTFKQAVMECLNTQGVRPNHRKTVIRGPGDRRIVLGMLVDGPHPRLPREYKDRIRQHLHYLTSPDFGPSAHAAVWNTSVSGIYHHVRGLIAWAQIVEESYGAKALARFQSVDWPPHGPQSWVKL